MSSSEQGSELAATGRIKPNDLVIDPLESIELPIGRMLPPMSRDITATANSSALLQTLVREERKSRKRGDETLRRRQSSPDFVDELVVGKSGIVFIFVLDRC